MIKKIVLNKVATYKNPTTIKFEENRVCSFFYGLNGAGKSTLSSFLYYKQMGADDPRYSAMEKKYMDCSLELGESSRDRQILVYNRDFIEKNFGINTEVIDGIEQQVSTVGENNVEAEANIRKAEEEIGKLRETIENAERVKQERAAAKTKIEDDRRANIAEYIKEKVNNSRGNGDNKSYIFEKVGVKKDKVLKGYDECEKSPAKDPSFTYDEIYDRLSQVKESKNPLDCLQDITVDLKKIEDDEIWAREIKSKEQNKFSDISGYSAWLSDGLKFIESFGEDCECPFCQSNSRSKLQSFIKELIGEGYERDCERIKLLIEEYCNYKSILETSYNVENGVVPKDKQQQLKDALEILITEMKNNTELMRQKELATNKEIKLTDSSAKLDVVRKIISEINDIIKEYNDELEDINGFKEKYLGEFWRNIIKDVNILYPQKTREIADEQKKIEEKTKEIKACETEIEKQKEIIKNNSEKQFEVAIDKINVLLKNVGITELSLGKIDGEKGKYKLIRTTSADDNDVYKTLSEGEKTMITFLYFIQVCEAANKDMERIVVIDDPMSSMSNLFMFNVASLIYRKFTYYGSEDNKNNKDNKNNENNKDKKYNYDQVIILTHNLNFFNAIVNPNKKNRDKFQQLFRIVKEDKISTVIELKYEELQNDYQVYWDTVKSDSVVNATLLANSMRNIIEHFFGLVEKRNQVEVFDDVKLNGDKYDSFKRFINNGSHSPMTNLNDSKDYDLYKMKKVFRELFIDMGYERHYNTMMGLVAE